MEDSAGIVVTSSEALHEPLENGQDRTKASVHDMAHGSHVAVESSTAGPGTVIDVSDSDVNRVLAVIEFSREKVIDALQLYGNVADATSFLSKEDHARYDKSKDPQYRARKTCLRLNSIETAQIDDLNSKDLREVFASLKVVDSALDELTKSEPESTESVLEAGHSKRCAAIPEIKHCTWQEWVSRARLPLDRYGEHYAMEMLVEEPEPETTHARLWQRSSASAPTLLKAELPPATEAQVDMTSVIQALAERIRIHSVPVKRLFAAICNGELDNDRCEGESPVFLRPYKLFVYAGDHIRAKLRELEQMY